MIKAYWSVAKFSFQWLLIPGFFFLWGLSIPGKAMVNDNGEITPIGHTYKVTRNPIASLQRTFKSFFSEEGKCKK